MNTRVTQHILLVLLMLAPARATWAADVPTRYTPHNTIIVWDLNGVIVQSDKSAMLSTFLKADHKFDMLINFPNTCFHLFSKFWSMLWSKKSSFEEIMRATEPLNPHLASLMRSMSSCQKVIPETATIIEELHSKHYRLDIATNMGIKTFQQIKNKYPKFFAYFSTIVTPDTIAPNNRLINKSDPAFFALYKKNSNPSAKSIIFIDDDPSNIQRAQGAGMLGFIFKNAKQLRCELQKIKLLSGS